MSNTKEQSHNKGGSRLGTEPVGKLLVNFAIPSIIAMVVTALYNIVDQVFIGQSIGELGNAATNVAFPLTTVCTALSLLFGIGGASAYNLARGRGEGERSIRYIGNGLSLLFGSGVILCIVTQLFLEPLLIFFGSPNDVLPLAIDYVRIVSFGFPFLILTAGGAHLVRADESPRYSMFCNMAGAVINLILDPLFIFGFKWGMKGAALATIAGQIVSAGMIVYYFAFRYKAGKMTLGYLLPKWEASSQLSSLGAASFLNQCAMMVVQITLNNSLTHYGAQSIYGESIPLACAGIASKVSFIFFGVCIGISHGMQPIISFNYGAKNYSRVKRALKLSIICSSAISVFAFIIFQTFPGTIISLFGEGSALYYEFAIRYFRIYMFCVFINNIQPMSSSFFTSIGKPTKGIFTSLTRQFIYLLPLILILPAIWGIDGMLFAAPIADAMAAIGSTFSEILSHYYLNTELI